MPPSRRRFIEQSSLAAMAFALPYPSRHRPTQTVATPSSPMQDPNAFDAIIVGGSYAGLSAAMALGRSLRRTLIIDGGQPCNRFTPHTHNFITHDGERPAAVAEMAKTQVLRYPTVQFLEDLATEAEHIEKGFRLGTKSGRSFRARKLVFATGVKDMLPELPGFAECWGKTIIHCPYCHGYEVKSEKTGILANGDEAFHYAQLISNWTDRLVLLTNGPSTLTPEQTAKLAERNIALHETPVERIAHRDGRLEAVEFKGQAPLELTAIYARPPMEQHCPLPSRLGCTLNPQGLLEVNMLQKTTVDHVFACGDAVSPLRAVAYAVASGNIAGAAANNEMTAEDFERGV